MTLNQYPEIAALNKALVGHNIQLSAGPDDARLQPHSYRRVRLALPSNGLELSIPVDDEFDDARRNNPALTLHLILSECETYEEAEDFLVWARETGFDPAEYWVRNLYAEIGKVVPKIREIFGREVKALSSYDFTLNAGAARALRNHSI
jgi:hypothetical protein